MALLNFPRELGASPPVWGRTTTTKCALKLSAIFMGLQSYIKILNEVHKLTFTSESQIIRKKLYKCSVKYAVS